MLYGNCRIQQKSLVFRRGGRFLVFDHAPFSAIRGEKCEMKLHGPHKNLFRLFLLHNTQGTQSEFLFSTETQLSGAGQRSWRRGVGARAREPGKEVGGIRKQPQRRLVRSGPGASAETLTLLELTGNFRRRRWARVYTRRQGFVSPVLP